MIPEVDEENCRFALDERRDEPGKESWDPGLDRLVDGISQIHMLIARRIWYCSSPFIIHSGTPVFCRQSVTSDGTNIEPTGPLGDVGKGKKLPTCCISTTTILFLSSSYRLPTTIFR